MNLKTTASLLISGALLAALAARAAEFPPVNPNATPEARALLHYLYTISGQHTMTGQHNFPNTKDQSTVAAARARGKIPAIFGQDFGFARDGDKDAASARPDMIAEVRRQFEKGSIITLCWHAVPPTCDEPVVFSPPGGANGANDHSVQGHLPDDQWNDIITPGTALYSKWCAQVDVVAGFLKQLQDAHVPVLWRPYHEMNGNWFWWGGRRGDKGTKVIYRQIYDRFVNMHKLNNLLWIWSVDQPSTPERQFADYSPGAQYFDIASFDDYGVFQQAFYDGMKQVSEGKIITLAEVGSPPALDVLEKQPDWTWWMTWAGMGGGRRGRGGNATNDPVKILVDAPRSWSLSDADYRAAIAPIRVAAGLPAAVPVPEMPGPATNAPARPPGQ